MAGGKTNYFENLMLDYYIGKANASTAPATLYMALFTSTLDDGLTSTYPGECTGGNYARAAITNSSNFWSNSTDGTKHNLSTITFTTNASTGWGTIKSGAIADAATGGNFLYWGDIPPQVVVPGNVVQFSTGTVVITED